MISWFSKKQTFIVMSTVETEYVVFRSCCPQLLWIQQQLHEYRIQASESPIFYGNISEIVIAYNPVLLLRTKNIDIRQNFIRDHIMKKVIILEYVSTEQQADDNFT